MEVEIKDIPEVEYKKIPEYKIKKKKELLANKFIQEMNEDNYKALNDFCLFYKSTCFLSKKKDFVMFPNDYTYEQHQFDKR